MQTILSVLEAVGQVSVTMSFDDLQQLIEKTPPNQILAEVRLSGFKMRQCPPGWNCTEYDPGVARIAWGKHTADYDFSRHTFNRSENTGAKCTTPASLWKVARWEHAGAVIEVSALAEDFGD